MRAACTRSSWCRNRNAIASDWPRKRAISASGRARVGKGRRARLPETPDGPGWNATCTSGCSAMARNTPAVARLKSSARALSLFADPLMPQPSSWQRLTQPRGAESRELARGKAAGRNILVEAALIIFGNRGTFRFVTLVHERDTERKADIAEDAGVFGPGNDGAGG